MRVHRQWSGMIGAGIAGLTLWGCPKEKPANESAATTDASGKMSGGAAKGGAASGGGELQIAVIPKGTENSYWKMLDAGAEAAGKEENVKIIWQGPNKENSFADQIDVVQTQINNHVSGIVLAATEQESLAPPVKNATDKGIPVVMVDSGLAKDKDTSVCYIATDNVEGGRKAADALALAMGDKGKVAVLSFVKGSQSSDDRERGFLEQIKKHPGITVVDPIYYDNSNPTDALNQSQNILTAHPDIAGIFATNEPGGIGAGNYLQQRKLAGKIKLVAYDSSDEEVKFLQDGTAQALIVQDPYQMGYKGVKTVVKAIKKQPLESKFIDSGVNVITKDNMNTPAMQKLLKPGT